MRRNDGGEPRPGVCEHSGVNRGWNVNYGEGGREKGLGRRCGEVWGHERMIRRGCRGGRGDS